MKKIDYRKKPTGAIHPDKDLDKYPDNLRNRKCSHCGETAFKKVFNRKTWTLIPALPFKCSYCGKIFCTECHLPENHRCEGLLPSKTFDIVVDPLYIDELKHLGNTSNKDLAVNIENLCNEKIASASPKFDIVESEKESVKQNENHICQYCFKKVSQVYKCTKCSLELCSEHFSNHSCIKISHTEPESHSLPLPGIEPQDKPIKSLNWNAIIIIVFGIILSSFIINNFLDNSNSQGSVTPSNSSNNNVEKVTNPQLTPKDSFEKINVYREQNKKYKILWSDNAYRLADFRASDMVTRNYFSRTTPDGKTVSDYIGKYNFYSNSAWGENLCKNCSDPAQTWIESSDHREILLGGWGKGAVACESDICVFIGVNE